MLSLYLVPSAILANEMFVTLPGWSAQPVPGDPSTSLLTVQWGNGLVPASWEDELEAMPGVLPLGLPWEPLPAQAVSALAAIQNPELASNKTVPALPITAAQPDTVGRALHKIGWRLF
jgi:hypothetical protein